MYKRLNHITSRALALAILANFVMDSSYFWTLD